jgi:hypothetical protein
MRKILVGLAVVMAAFAFADFEGSYILPLDHMAIQYNTASLTGRVAMLQQQLRDGKATLGFDDRHGYLESKRKALHAGVVAGPGLFEDQFPGSAHLAADGARLVARLDDVLPAGCRGDVWRSPR